VYINLVGQFREQYPGDTAWSNQSLVISQSGTMLRTRIRTRHVSLPVSLYRVPQFQFYFQTRYVVVQTRIALSSPYPDLSDPKPVIQSERYTTTMPPTIPHLVLTSSPVISLYARAGGRARVGGSIGGTGQPALNTGVVIGVVLGCLFAFAIVACLGVRHYSKKKKNDQRRVEQERRWWMEGRR
jgi:hypothetical protein